MRKVQVMAAVVLLCLAGAGCGDSKPTHESVAKEGLQLLVEFNTILDGITDEATAKAAEPKLKALGEKMNALKKKEDALGKPSPEVEKKIKETLEKQMTETAGKLFGNMMRLSSKPEVQKILEGAMKNVNLGAPAK